MEARGYCEVYNKLIGARKRHRGHKLQAVTARRNSKNRNFLSEHQKTICSSRTTRDRQEPNSMLERGYETGIERIFICPESPSTS